MALLPAILRPYGTFLHKRTNRLSWRFVLFLHVFHMILFEIGMARSLLFSDENKKFYCSLFFTSSCFTNSTSPDSLTLMVTSGSKPSVLSDLNNTFNVWNISLKSSQMLYFSMYIKSSISLSLGEVLYLPEIWARPVRPAFIRSR